MAVAKGLQGEQRAFEVGFEQQTAVAVLLPELRAIVGQFGGVMTQAHVQAGDAFARLGHQRVGRVAR